MCGSESRSLFGIIDNFDATFASLNTHLSKSKAFVMRTM